MAKEVIVKADSIRKRRKTIKIAKLSLLILLLLLIGLYIVLQIIYSEGKFTVTLDSNSLLESGITLYDNLKNDSPKRKLEASAIEFMDNISEKWLPKDIDTEADGSHNGQNYIAYSFYIENRSNNDMDYWYELIIDDVVKNVDEAVRIKIYLNGEPTTYAKKNALSGEAEKNTIAFREDIESEERIIVLEQRKGFNSSVRDRFTIVVWIEGDDPDCVDALIGGELKMHMNITEEHIDKKDRS